MARGGVRKDANASPDMGKDVFSQVGKVQKHIKPNKKNVKDDAASLRWWMQPEDKIAVCIGDVVGRIEAAGAQRRTNFVRFAHLYGNWEALGWSNVQAMANNQQSSNNMIRINLIQSVIDTAAAKMTKDTPAPYFITKGADFFERIAAEQATDFVAGVLEQNQFEEISNEVFLDGGLYGTGVPHWFIKDGRIQCEWCFIDEIKVDDYDGLKKKPRSMHRVKIVNKEVLAAEWPDHADELDKYVADMAGARFKKKQSVVEMVRVRESWHLPSRKGATDGVHCFSVGDLCLQKEVYTKDYFPLPPWRWYNKPLGWYGRSITEEIYSIQRVVNQMSQTAQEAYQLVGIPVCFVESGSEVSEDDIGQNFVARIVNYSGTKPQFETPEPLPGSFFQLFAFYVSMAYKLPGISEASATGTKPPGVESGEAIREVIDIDTGRYAQTGNRWERWHCENFKIVFDLAKDLQQLLKNRKDKDGNADPGTYKMSKTYKKEVLDLDFADFEDFVDNFTVKCDPISALPDSPQGRTETISQWIQNKWIGQARAMELTNLDPDLDREVELQISSLRRTDKMLSQITYKGKMQQPDPYMKLDQTLEVSLQIYNLVASQGCPEERLSMLRDFIDLVVAEQGKPNPYYQAAPAPPLAPNAGPAGALPPGAGQAQGAPVPMPQPSTVSSPTQ